MKWIVEIEAGPAFMVNAAQALRAAAEDKANGPTRSAFMRLADACDQAKLKGE
jgi:hypothetical protein